MSLIIALSLCMPGRNRRAEATVDHHVVEIGVNALIWRNSYENAGNNVE
jgi:hypothetical protein